MSYDELAYSGFSNSTRLNNNNTGYCVLCNTVTTIENNKCLSCGFNAIVNNQPPATAQNNNNNNTSNHNNNNNNNTTTTNNARLPLDFNIIRQYLNDNIDLEQLFGELLNSNDYNTKTTGKRYIEQKQTKQLTINDIIRPEIIIKVNNISKQIKPTIADFGCKLLHKHNIDDSEHTTQIHYNSKLIICDNLTGQTIHNSDMFNNNIILMQRGDITFLSKSRLVQQYNGIGLICYQANNNQIFPFTISDTSNNNNDIYIPVFMISHNDGNNIVEVGKKYNDIDVIIQTYRVDLSCAICTTDYNINDECIELECKHIFCIDCIKPWLTKHSSQCPVCRYQLPSDNNTAEQRKKLEAERKYNNEQLNQSMFN